MIKRLIAGSAIAMTALFGVAACGSAAPVDEGTSTVLGDNEVTLTEIDGVQCVVMDGYQSGAISCNWEAYNSSQTP